MRFLQPTLGHRSTKATTRELASATRLLNCRFATWEFFHTWLRNQDAPRGGCEIGSERLNCPELWAALHPSSGFRAPSKLLHGPFTFDKVQYLRTLTAFTATIEEDAIYAEFAYEGLCEAICERHIDAISVFLAMGLKCNTELLRHAVVGCGCHQGIVRLLLSCPKPLGESRTFDSEKLNLLDPVLWAWADKMRAKGDPIGQWLMDRLQDTLLRPDPVE